MGDRGPAATRSLHHSIESLNSFSMSAIVTLPLHQMEPFVNDGIFYFASAPTIQSINCSHLLYCYIVVIIKTLTLLTFCWPHF